MWFSDPLYMCPSYFSTPSAVNRSTILYCRQALWSILLFCQAQAEPNVRLATNNHPLNWSRSCGGLLTCLAEQKQEPYWRRRSNWILILERTLRQLSWSNGKAEIVFTKFSIECQKLRSSPYACAQYGGIYKYSRGRPFLSKTFRSSST